MEVDPQRLEQAKQRLPQAKAERESLRKQVNSLQSQLDTIDSILSEAVDDEEYRQAVLFIDSLSPTEPAGA